MDGLNEQQWRERLNAVADAMDGHPARLCLIGSAAGIFSGQPSRTSMDLDVLACGGRTSMDLDVYAPGSRYDDAVLRKAVEAAGLLFDPKGMIEPDRPYVQIVHEGIVRVGAFRDADTMGLHRSKDLDVVSAPAANLVASKLVRGDTRDIEDIFYLMAKFAPPRTAVEAIVMSFPERQRLVAMENMVYLDIMDVDTGLKV